MSCRVGGHKEAGLVGSVCCPAATVLESLGNSSRDRRRSGKKAKCYIGILAAFRHLIVPMMRGVI